MRRGILHAALVFAIQVMLVAAAKCKKTTTVYTTTTLKRKQRTSTLPTTTVFVYSSTVLVGTPYAGPAPVSTPTDNPTNCAFTTLTPTAKPYNKVCKKATTTVTVNKQCTVTHIASPPPDFVTKEGVLTTSVPSFCTTPGRDALSNGAGNVVTLLAYPYFPQNPVDCCIFCAKQVTADLVAAAQVLDCQCLVDTGGDYPGKNQFCPRGIEPYEFGTEIGVAFPGPCRTGAA